MTDTAITPTAIVQGPAGVRRHSVLGGEIAVRLHAQETGGSLGLVEQVIPAGFPGPALHVHPSFDETFLIVAGTLAFRVGEDAYEAPAGTLAFIPRGVPHTFANPTSEPVRTIVLATPGGFEGYFEEIVAAIEDGGGAPPPEEEFVRLGIAYGSIPA